MGNIDSNNVPNLRFKKFDGEWVFTHLGNAFSIFNGYAFASIDSVKNEGVLWVKIADVGIGRMRKDNLSYLPTSFIVKHKKFVLKKGDYVVALTRPILNGKLKIAKIDKFFHNSLLNQRVGKVITSNNIDFIYNLLKCEKLIKSIECNIAGSDPPNLSTKEINKIITYLPSLKEQTKIANFLTEVDTKISQLKTKKEKLEQYKKGVMQKLFSRELRFKDDNGKVFPDWEDKKLGEVLYEHKLKSTGNEEVHSVSVHKGVVNQIEHLGRSFAAKDTSHYNRVLPNDIIYTKSPTGNFPLGIIKQNHVKESVIISPLYGVFTPETKELGYILNVHFESSINTSNYLSSIIQKGAKNTINITNKTFLSKKMFLPTSKKEQTIMGSFLIEIGTKISQVEKQLSKTEEFKKGLLQQMFV